MAEEIYVCDKLEVGTVFYEKSVSGLYNYAFYKITKVDSDYVEIMQIPTNYGYTPNWKVGIEVLAWTAINPPVEKLISEIKELDDERKIHYCRNINIDNMNCTPIQDQFVFEID